MIGKSIRWSRVGLGLILVWIVVLATSCGLPHITADADEDAETSHTVYIVKHGWHAGIVLRPGDLPEGLWPEFPGVPRTPYIEVGWGEAGYYPNPDPGVGSLLAAGLWPTSSVVHVVPLPTAPPQSYARLDQVRLEVSPQELEALARFIRETVHLDDGRARPAADGWAPDSRFFASPLRYHAFNNCNHWAAAALRAIGCDVWPRNTLIVRRVMRQAETCAAERGGPDTDIAP